MQSFETVCNVKSVNMGEICTVAIWLLTVSSVFVGSHCQPYQLINLTESDVSCNMSTVYLGNSDGDSLNCTGAIDNITDTEWRPTRDDRPNCIFTQKDSNPAYWFLHLGRPRNIHKITVYYVNGYGGYLRNVRITVDGKEVYKYLDSFNNPQSMTIGLPTSGHIIKVERTDTHERNYLPLCEVQLWDCETNRYGKQCASTCSPNCGDNDEETTCDSIAGDCLNDCKPSDGNFSSRLCRDCTPGWYGEDCNQVCNSTCKTHYGAKPCNRSTGRCSAGCEDGFYGDTCETPCPEFCAEDNCTRDGECYDCKEGFWGLNCTEECSDKCDGSCDQKTGRCEKCVAGYWGEHCNETCNRGCENNNCSRKAGRCTCEEGWTQPCNVCDDRHYGEHCDSVCGNCTDGDPCNKTTGYCPSCPPGLDPPFCQQECANRTYGQNCSLTCGHCEGTAACDVIEGFCPDRCDPGYRGNRCDDACPQGSYGDNCSFTCGKCLNDTACNHVTGVCDKGCRDGFSSESKCIACEVGQWGDNCNATCGHCMGDGSCDMGTGVCLGGCLAGWNGTMCLQKADAVSEDDDDGGGGGAVAGAIGGVVAAVAVVALIVGSIILWRRRQGATKGSKTEKNTENDRPCSAHSPSNILLDTIDNDLTADTRPKARVKPLQQSKDHEEVSFTNALAVTDETSPADGHVYGNVDIAQPSKSAAAKPASDATGNIYGNMTIPDTQPPVSEKPKPKPRKKPEKAKKKEKKANKTSGNKPHMYENITISGESVPAITDQGSNATSGTDQAFSKVPGDKPTEEAKNSEELSHGKSTEEISGMKRDDSMAVLIREEDGNYDSEDLYGSFQPDKNRPQFDKFQNYLLNCLASGKLTEQFAALVKGMKHPHDVGMTDENNRKNRFKAICAYDYNRVVLHRAEGDNSSDYINASYIKGCRRENEYIATQGPRVNTVDDLWWMVWQEGITQIVMLTNLKEDGRDKCEEYWPAPGKFQTYGPLTVRNQDEQERADFTIRFFVLSITGTSGSRHVTQYHYKAWPDHGVPQAASLVDFWRYVKDRNLDTDVPLMVHCSAGVGRTGTYIALDIASELEKRDEEVNVNEIVKNLREQRSLMVQSEAQYRFLHEVILEAHTSRASRKTVAQFDAIFPDPIDINTDDVEIDSEFEMLQQMGQFTVTPQHILATLPENVDKNRNMDALPDDDDLCYITVPLSGRNQYINAVYMSSFQHRQGFILTQLPLPDTIVDFWRMMVGCGISTIVSLGHPNEESSTKDFCSYWPRTTDEVLTTGPYTVAMTSSSAVSSQLTCYSLILKTKPLPPKKEESRRTVEVFHYTDWEGHVPGDTPSLLHLVDRVKAVQSGHNTQPVVVQCIDGMAKSGLFCAIYDIISRMTYDDEVDIFLTARHIHRTRPQAIVTKAQYRYLYKVVQEYVRHLSVSVYGNVSMKSQAV